MTTERILDKIRKCLAIANDSRGNATECENAMRQAQALMAKHGLDELDIDAAAVTTITLRSRVSVRNAAQWEVNMCHVICSMYGLHTPMWAPGGPEPTKKGWWFFIGSKAYIEVAEYTYEVLYRQLLAARNDFVRTLGDDFGRSEKSQLANSFCLGWVTHVSKKVSAANDPDGSMAKRIAAYMSKHNLDKGITEKEAHDSKKKIDGNAYVAGVQTAKDVRLNAAASHSKEAILRLS